MAGVTGSPTVADVIYIGLGGNDFLGVFNSPAVRYTAAQFETNFNTLRSNLIAQGCWVPGTTQIILGDIFRSSTLYELWFGLERVLAKSTDRIALVSAASASYLDESPYFVHFTPASLTAMGATAGNLVFNQIPVHVPHKTLGRKISPIALGSPQRPLIG
jgi:lysophospholipase L1-like esterase